MGARPPTNLRHRKTASRVLLCVIAWLSTATAQIEYGATTQLESPTNSLWPLPEEGSQPWSDNVNQGFRKFFRYGVGSSSFEKNAERASNIVLNQIETQERFTFYSLSFSRQHLLPKTSGDSASNAWVVSAQLPGRSFDFGYQPLAASPANCDAPSPWYNGPFEASTYIAYGLGITHAKSEFSLKNGYESPDWVFHSSNSADVPHWIAGPQFTVGRIATWRRWTIQCSASTLVGYGWTRFEKTSTYFEDYPNANNYGLPHIDLDADGIISISPFFDANERHTRSRSKQHLGHTTEAKILSSYSINSQWSFDLGFRLVGIGPWYNAHETTNAYWLTDVRPPKAKYAVVGNFSVGFTYFH